MTVASLPQDRDAIRVSEGQQPPDSVRAAYVHVPFCRHRCGYCDFTLVAGRDDLVPRYLAALERELATLGGPWEIDTLFIGGGTPTHLPPASLASLLTLLQERFQLSEQAEFSIEANPSGLSDEHLNILAAHGVNRVSLGVQSLSQQHLLTLERDHTPAEALSVIDRVRGHIENVAVDLIFGVPEQSLNEWSQTLRQTIDRGVNHVSTYGLTIEKGTTFWSRREQGTLLPVDEELEREMYQLAMELLPAAGFTHYELSNFAQPGRECRHNQTYWRGDAYYGVGPGAASYLNGVRRLNHRSVFTWLKRVEEGASPVADSETLSGEARAREG
ncbi:MAG: radical SAM family heme chaperone HemW [Planctomycetaceae bacterium]